jgi:hypothetical protein
MGWVTLRHSSMGMMLGAKPCIIARTEDVYHGLLRETVAARGTACGRHSELLTLSPLAFFYNLVALWQTVQAAKPADPMMSESTLPASR